MPYISDFFSLGLTQHQLDFVNINTDFDTPVYVDPYAIEVRNDIWSGEASQYLREFFLEVLEALRNGDDSRAEHLMSHLHEPKETFLGVSKGKPKGRGVGHHQASSLIRSIKSSKAFQSGRLSDLSEMSLFVENFNRDKTSDLTTNIIRKLLIDYTQDQCSLYNIPVSDYSGPPLWQNDRKLWISEIVKLPYVDEDPVLLVPKDIVRRRLSLDYDQFYNKQIVSFLVAEHKSANSSMVQTLKNGKQVVRINEVKKDKPKSKRFINDIVDANPHLLDLLKQAATETPCLHNFNNEEGPSLHMMARSLAEQLPKIPSGKEDADRYHNLIMGALNLLFYPNLIHPKKEWEINDGRKRIDLVYTNAANNGFFSQRRDDPNAQANMVIIECKNYSSDIANPEIDQLLGRFDNRRGKFGILTCRAIDDEKKLLDRCRDISRGQTGYIIVLTDNDIIQMLEATATLDDGLVEGILYKKYRELLE